MSDNVTKAISFKRSKPSNNPPKGNNYLLVIGIDKYVHLTPLNNAVKDAKDMVDLLLKKFQFETDFTKVLFDQDATKENIYAAFRDLAERVTSSDNVIIYFSGHGEFDKVFGEGYWIPVNAERDKVDQYVPNSMINRILNSIKSHHIFLMIDSCFSGTLFAESLGRNSSMRKERDPSRWGLTAGRNEVVNDGMSGHNSPFAESVLYHLKNATQPIGVAELCDHVLEVVSANANQTPRGEPLKVNGHRGGQFVFHLKKDELADWAECKSVGTLQAYQNFVVKYPEGRYRATAQAKVKNIQADLLWKKINQAADADINAVNSKLSLVNQFVEGFESELHFGEVLNIGQLLEYKKEMLLANSSEFGLRKFLRQSIPKVSGAVEIRNQAQQFLNQFNSETGENTQVDTIEASQATSLFSTPTNNSVQPIPSTSNKPKVEQINKVNLNISNENQPQPNNVNAYGESILEKYWKVGILILLAGLLIIAVVIMTKMSSSEESDIAEAAIEETISTVQNSESENTSPPEKEPELELEVVKPKVTPQSISSAKPTIRYKTHSVVISAGNAHTEWEKRPAKFKTTTQTILVVEAHKKGATFKTVTERVKVKDATVRYELKSCKKINLVIDAKSNRSKTIDICQYFDPPKKSTIPAIYGTVNKKVVLTQGTGEMVPGAYSTKDYEKLITPEKVKNTLKKNMPKRHNLKVIIKENEKIEDHLKKAGIEEFKIRD